MLWIERAAHPLAAMLEYMGVDHGGLDILVSQEFLHRANIIAIFEQMCGETVA